MALAVFDLTRQVQNKRRIGDEPIHARPRTRYEPGQDQDGYDDEKQSCYPPRSR